MIQQHPRVVVRPPTFADETAFLAAVSRSRSLHRGWVSPPTDRVAFRKYVENYGAEPNLGFLVIERATGALAGVINLGHITRGALQSAYVGYYAFARYERRGLMREGMRLLLSHAFKKLRLHRIEANIQPGNRASRRLVESLGFALEGFSPRYLKVGGRWRDHERWALLADNARRR